MRRILFAGTLALMVLARGAGAQQAPPGAPPDFKDLKDRMSYIIGLNIAQNIKSDQMDLDVALMVRGLQDGMAGAKPALSEEQIQQSITAFQQKFAADETKRVATAQEKNKTEGEAFLEANKNREGIVTLPSGLQYRVLTAGNGPSPQPTDEVTVNYRGTLINGQEFDSSYKRGQPASFPVNKVIAGWTEALKLMKVGDKWEIYIPSNLAYGPNGAGNMIGPNSTLIFQVELLAVKPALAR